MVATFHFHYLGQRIKNENCEVGNNTQQLLSKHEFTESFLFQVIFVTYNIGIYICIYIYKVSYIHSFFVIFNCNVFSALHAKHFEIWKNILWNWWVDCFIARSIKWCDILGAHSESIFPFMQYFFLSRKLCFFWSPCLLLIAGSISGFFWWTYCWVFSWKFLLPFE